jgi:hypothetical protein
VRLFHAALIAGVANVSSWHFSDLMLALADVCSSGESGSCRPIASMTRLTKAVKTRLNEGRAELFSQLPSSDRSCRCIWFLHRRNRDGNSTRKLDV